MLTLALLTPLVALLPFHLDLNLVLGIIGGMVGLGVYFRTANLNALKNEVESLRRQVEDLRISSKAQVEDLSARYKALEVEHATARREVVAHYTARTEIADENRVVASENRELHKVVRAQDDEIKALKGEMIELQKNIIRAA